MATKVRPAITGCEARVAHDPLSDSKPPLVTPDTSLFQSLACLWRRLSLARETHVSSVAAVASRRVARRRAASISRSVLLRLLATCRAVSESSCVWGPKSRSTKPRGSRLAAVSAPRDRLGRTGDGGTVSDRTECP